MAYEPRGKVGQVVEAMRAEPARIWTSADVAQVMEVQQAAVTAHLDTAIKHQVIFRKLENGRCQYSVKPFPVDDIRIPQVPTGGYVPPQMIATRPGSEVPRKTLPPPADAVQNGAQNIPEIIPAAPAPAPAPTAATVACGARPGDGMVGFPPAAAPAEPKPEEADEEPAEFDCWLSMRTGQMILVGVEVDEDGRVVLTPEQVGIIRAKTAWAPLPRTEAADV